MVDKRCLIMDPNGARAPAGGFSMLDVIRIEQFSHFSQHGHRGLNILGDGLVMVGPKLGGEPQKFKIFSAGN